ncbi:unnamed protein product [Paramecium sonneborni]|uniref:Uncharacterized protein n=1 Tax=Paramecium sonneborni TaxID=65129 RepID=A0A8S1P761_9CILI|nr:unnamed protein product [Paramecium sonneborni]
MNSTIQFPQNDDIANHKIKALELNANQFQAQFKPLFHENTKLKQHVISLNFYIEERKLQLSNLINDTGPNGEDRVLIKAVADFKQICDLLEEELLRMNNTIVENTNENQKLKILIKQIKDKSEQDRDRYFIEKQSFIDQNRRLNEYHKQQSLDWEQIQNRMKMKIEDLSSQLLQLQQNINKIHKHYKYQIEEKSLIQNQVLIKINLEKQEMIEKFEVERRSYLQQLEIFSNKMNENKTILINEYEYKIQSQRIKLESQIQKLMEDYQDYQTQFQNIIEKNKILQFQIDSNIPQIASLEKEIQDQKYKVFVCEETIKTKDSSIQQKDIKIEQLNEQIKKLNQEKGQHAIKEQLKRQGSIIQQNKTQSPDKSLQQNKQTYHQRQVIKHRDPIKQSINSDSYMHSSLKRVPQQKQEEFPFQETTIEQYVENNKLENLQQIQESKKNSRSSSIDESSNSPLPFIKVINNEIQKSNNNGQQTQHSDATIQCDLMEFINSSIIQKYEQQITKLNKELIQQKHEYEIQLKLKQDELKIILEKNKSQKSIFEQNQEKQLQDLQKQQQEDIIQKDNTINQLKLTLNERNLKIQKCLDQENIYKGMIEELNEKFRSASFSQNEVILKFQDDMKLLEQQNQIEQKRLLELNEKLKEAHKQEIENLNNQHQLDQEQLNQEKARLQEQRVEHEQYVRQTNDLLEQARSKEFLLDNYRRELLKTNEIVKYLSLEIENFKKINSIFRSKNDHSAHNFLYNSMGFLPTEMQDNIKQKMNKVKQKNQSTNILKDVYAMNFQLQKGTKMRQAKLVSMNATNLDQNKLKQEMKQKLESLNELNKSLPKMNSKNFQEYDRTISDRKFKLTNNKNFRSKTQYDDQMDSDPKRMMQDINQKEIMLLQNSQLLLSQINFQTYDRKDSHQIKKNNLSTSKI